MLAIILSGQGSKERNGARSAPAGSQAIPHRTATAKSSTQPHADGATRQSKSDKGKKAMTGKHTQGASTYDCLVGTISPTANPQCGTRNQYRLPLF